jgi:hypothetical protein
LILDPIGDHAARKVILHIGGDQAVRRREIVAIFDRRAVKMSKATKEFLELAQAEGRFVPCPEEPKSYVVTADKVYASPISVWTLARRATSEEVL